MSEHTEEKVVHTREDVLKRIIAYKDYKKDRQLLIIPSGFYGEVKELLESLSIFTEEEILEKFDSEEDLIALKVVEDGFNNTERNDMFKDTVNDRNFEQGLQVGDKNICVRELQIKSDALKGVLSGKKALLKLNAKLGLSNEVQIPLYHSGFHITLSNLDEATIISLSAKLARRKLELGKNTFGQAFSNDNVLFADIILDFIVDHMSSTSLKLDPDDDIKEFIKTPDIYTMAIAIMRSIEPEGFDITRSCHNSIVVDENVKPKCNFTLAATLDLEKIIFVDKDAFDEFHKELLLKRSPNSVTKDDVKQYQDTLSVLKPKDVSVKLSEDSNIILTLQVPDILDHIHAGELWIKDVQNTVEEELVSMPEQTDNVKAVLINKITKATLLNRYLHYVKEISIDDAIVKDRPTIYEILNRLMSTDTTYRATVEALVKFVETNVVSVVGIPQYVCPSCQEAEDILEGSFKEVIPLNVYHTFLESCTLKVYELEKRTENTF